MNQETIQHASDTQRFNRLFTLALLNEKCLELFIVELHDRPQ